MVLDAFNSDFAGNGQMLDGTHELPGEDFAVDGQRPRAFEVVEKLKLGEQRCKIDEVSVVGQLIDDLLDFCCDQVGVLRPVEPEGH